MTIPTADSHPGEEYQLRGEINGRVQRFRLKPGTNRCGNSPAENEVVLEASGVSRRHAVIEVGSRHLILIDLESKNGTFLNGRSVRRAHLRVGDEIGIGELQLQLERLQGDDAMLGLELKASPPSVVSFVERETSRLIKETPGHHVQPWLELVDTLAEHLLSAPDAPLAASLQQIVQALAVQACCLVEKASDDRVGILATAGEAQDESIESGLEAFLAAILQPPADGRAESVRSFEAKVAAGVTGSALLSLERPALGLFVIGDGVAKTEASTALAILLRLIAHRRVAATHTRHPARMSVSGLTWPEGYIPGTSAAMAALHDQVRSLAPGKIPVLIQGETGVGKELVALMLHTSSPRRHHDFVAFNCAAIPRDLLEAELFGVEKGVATGVTQRAGLFQRAHRSTLFLDEVGDMPPELQAKLLRALQEGEIRPLGGAPQTVDVRVISATNLDLRSRIAAGSFRADLYYRLAGYTLPIPPLRQRKDDLSALIGHFLRRSSQELGKAIRGVTVKALRALHHYPWPGNVRELEHEIRRLAYLTNDGQAIDFEMLSQPVRQGSPEIESSPKSEDQVTDESLDLAQQEKRLIRHALEVSGGQISAAARRLGISRDALRRRLSRHGLRDNGSS